MKHIIYLFIVLALFALIAPGAARADDCTACDDGSCTECATTSCATNDHICVGQCTVRAIKVTEWGVQTELICPPRCRLFCFGRGCDACDGSSCDGVPGDGSSCDESSCDGACDGAGRHLARLSLPGFRPRVRKRLMRKTLVYKVPAVEFVPRAVCTSCGNGQPCGNGCDADYDTGGDTLQIDFAKGSSPAESMASTTDSRAIHWLNVDNVPGTMLLALDKAALAPLKGSLKGSLQGGATDTASSDVRKIHWIDGQDVDQPNLFGTMSVPAGIQSPAPISSAPTADAMPLILQPYPIQR